MDKCCMVVQVLDDECGQSNLVNKLGITDNTDVEQCSSKYCGSIIVFNLVLRIGLTLSI